jgi:hypothetical protein
MVIGHKPVVRLLLLTSADVARYCLPDHPVPSFRTVLPQPDRFPVSHCFDAAGSSNHRKPHRRAPWKTHGAAHFHFIARPAKSVREPKKESRGEANRNSRRREYPETERAGSFDWKSERKGGEDGGITRFQAGPASSIPRKPSELQKRRGWDRASFEKRR